MRLEQRLPVSAEARGRLREVWARLQAESDQIEAAIRRIPSNFASDARCGFGKRADAAMAAIMKAIPATPLLRERRSAIWRFVRPSGDPDCRCLEVAALFLNTRMKHGFMIAPFGLTLSHHALGRLLDRTRFQVDPVRSALQAHTALAALDPEEGARLFGLPVFQLPAARGAFLVTSTADPDTPMAFAKTWVDADQLHADQQRHADAWARLIHAESTGDVAA